MRFGCVLTTILILAAGSASPVPARQEELPPPHPKQAVLETRLGTIVIELYPQAAPKHVESFLERIDSGFYQGTAFHRAIAWGIIQGGDPLSRDPAASDRYGSGGLNELAREDSPVSHLRGTLSAVLIPGQPDSAGSQFFICVTDQTQLDGQFTAFGRIVEGMQAVEQLSQLPTDDRQALQERVEIDKTYLRDPPPPEVIPFVDTPAQELNGYRAIVRTRLGEFEVEFFAEEAPQHVRQFLRFAQLGLYDGTSFHRIVPGFVIQGGNLADRQPAVPEKYQHLLQPLQAEFNQRLHEAGVLSMARAEDPDSGMDSFFVVLGRQEHLDGNYTAFGRVVRGMETVQAIAGVPLEGESPVEAITMHVEVKKGPPRH